MYGITGLGIFIREEDNKKEMECVGVIPYILFAIGCIFIIKGGDLFVEAAIWIARITGIPEVIIGATIVSLATTLPELMVSVVSTYQGKTSLAIGNAVGSGICNIGLILGVSCLIKPSKIYSRFFNLKGIIMVLYTSILWMLSFRGGWIGYADGWILIIFLVIYLAIDYTIIRYKNPQRTSSNWTPISSGEKKGQSLKFLTGLGLILVGARLLVKYGVEIARFWQVPEMIIGLSIVALGTSLPELVTSITAAIKGHENLSLGNIIGANVFNVTLVLGVSALVEQLEVPVQSIIFDMPVLLIISLMLVLPAIFTKRVSRLQGFILLLSYLSYIGIIFFVFG